MHPPDAVTVEVIGSALASITEEMGEALVRASFSTNIKERRDCSTALFERAGRTLCQAEHILIHLGSFLEAVPAILARHPEAELRPGDVFVFSDAYAGGGTHLPDIVLAEPIIVEGQGSLEPGLWMAIVTPGAGGYGPPTVRDPVLAERDRREGRG
ncbi:hydantoinase B/oxoprolinase family protein [Belnapia rosea]|uniref:hydantoinase B/oxoprolinase family protein n=1 Tax=Belnapia rosea TaxID=938405 RepID=UPI0008851C7A|nr:hydantoinase B/oxoprolinase family protein [Belnapia rosea]SDB18344.1 Hydantoinase B/oxoprolinase [Belnapia rosea]